MLTAIVLAAGSSKRMGNENKLLLPYNGKTILESTLENILHSAVENLILVTGYENKKVEKLASPFNVQTIYNPDFEMGITTSIQAGVRATTTGDGFVICLADMVLIRPQEYTYIQQCFLNQLQIDSKCICLPYYQQQRGNPVVFAAFYTNTILNHKDHDGCKSIIWDNRQHWCRAEMDTDHVISDCDSPEDYLSLSNQNTLS